MITWSNDNFNELHFHTHLQNVVNISDSDVDPSRLSLPDEEERSVLRVLAPKWPIMQLPTK